MMSQLTVGWDQVGRWKEVEEGEEEEGGGTETKHWRLEASWSIWKNPKRGLALNLVETEEEL